MPPTPILKIGIVDYLNALPMYYPMLQGNQHWPYHWVRNTPVVLNRQIAKGELDLSLVSSFEYAQHFQNYYLLPNLSISADGPVHSIYLFTQTPLAELQGCIYLTPHSHTSTHLVQYLLRNHQVTFSTAASVGSTKVVGELLIGDEAIRCYYQQRYPYAFDLSAWWKQETALPFVFAVWVVRRMIYEKYPLAIQQICAALIRSRQQAAGYYAAMAQAHYAGIFPDVETCMHYLSNLRYDWSPAFQAGFLKFQQVCHDLGFLEQVAPLEFIALPADLRPS